MVMLKYDSIKDTNAHEEIEGFRDWCNNKKDCLYKDKTRKYHGWMHLDNLKEGKTIQCGYHSGNCDSRTLYGVGGYRNVCPIGGANGDFPAPAKLQISNFNLVEYNISKTSTINKITISFEHRMNGVSTVTGQPYYGSSNSPDFTSDAVKIYFTANNERISKEEYIFGNPNNKSDKKFTSISCTFKDIPIEKFLEKDFSLNIEYNFNHNTNPGIIYLQGLSVDVDYQNSEIFIEGSSPTPSLYTSKDAICTTSIHQTIKAGYKTDKEVISPNEAPKVLTSEIWCVDKPNDVKVKAISTSNSAKIFEITDTSGISGKKYITYALSSNKDKKVTLGYHATARSKPSYKIIKKYKTFEDYDENKSYIIFRNGCAPSISIYIDSLKNQPLNLSVANQNSSSNLLNSNQIKKFHDRIKELPCGKHTLYIQRGNESLSDVRNNKVYIEILPMNFKFSVYSGRSEGEMIFPQSKDPINRYENIFIKRIDNEPINSIPKLLISDETQPSKPKTYLENFQKNEVKTIQIDKYFSGKYTIGLTSSLCKSKKQEYNIEVTPYHKQNYDYIFTRGQDGTAFDFDYLVAWEGDNIKNPITVEDIVFSNSRNDIGICSNSVQANLLDIGLIELRIKNKKQNESIKNLKIELNTLTENENDVITNTTMEWTSIDGIFNQFYNLFDEYNSTIKDNVEILNLTPDNDLYEEENVYLLIHEIDPNNVITIYLPFRSTLEKTVYLQYLLFDEPLQINSLESCFSDENNEKRDSIEISIKDLILTDLEISGNTDLLLLDPRYSCPEECYTTVDVDENDLPIEDIESGGITYKITNIDTNDFNNRQFLPTKIINSQELIPYAYIIDDQYYQLLDENNNRLNVQEERYMRDANGNIMYYQQTDNYGEFIYDIETGNTIDDETKPIYAPNKVEWIFGTEIIKKPMINYNINCKTLFPQSEEIVYSIKTDKNGTANFFIPIPVSLNTSYTIQELLQEVLVFTFNGNDEYNASMLTQKENIPYPTVDKNKDETYLKYYDNFKRYKPGETAIIPVSLFVNSKIPQNYLTFNAELGDKESYDEVTVLYKICNIPDNKGIFKTTFKTNDKSLVENEVSKNIYCGMDSGIQVSTKIEKKIVEKNNLNIIDITIQNQEKENHDVEIQINLDKRIDFIGKYEFLDINIDHGDYSVIQDENEHYISWLIGKMNPFEKENAIIKIKAKEVGLSDIKVNCYDYLHQKNQEPRVIQNRNCPKCAERKIKIADSKWTEFDGVMYKLFEDGKYRRRINNEWVEKQ